MISIDNCGGSRRRLRARIAGFALVGVVSLSMALSGCGITWTSSANASTPTPTPSGSASATGWADDLKLPTSSASPTASPSASSSPSESAASASPSASQTASAPEPAPTIASTPVVRDKLSPGDSGDDVLAMQKRLADLGYWLGEPDGGYGGLTQQAVYAVQKAAGLDRDGVAGAATLKAIADGVRPISRVGGNGIEIDLEKQLLLVVRDGAVRIVLNTSTGSNTPYAEVYKGTTYRGDAQTPPGTFAVFHQVDKLDEGPLGGLWRPKYFNGGIAVHGAPYIPPYPASHGCARVSNAAMNMIWAQDLMPMGGQVTVY